MSARSFIASLFGSTLKRGSEERELSEELRAYHELLVEEKRRAGLPAADAMRAALIEVGGTDRVKEAVRDERSTALLEILLRDLRLAWRGLLRKPGFAVTVVLTLALGVGGTTGIFSVVNAVMFRTLPAVASPGRLVSLSRVQPTGVYDNMG
ncbi:MAG: permease prefix domain 1-containing protein, partial [Gemmatimonadales bacterium]